MEDYQGIYQDSDEDYEPPMPKSGVKRIKLESKTSGRPNKALDNLFSQFNDLVSSNKSKNSNTPDQKKNPVVIKLEAGASKNFNTKISNYMKKNATISQPPQNSAVSAKASNSNHVQLALLTAQSQVKNFKCKICDMSFLFETTLEKHLVRHEIDSENPKPVVISKPLSADSKKRRILGVKPRTNFVYYICGCCKIQFLDSDSLMTHEVTHENQDGTFGCLKCKQYFLTKAEVVAHTIEHANDKEDYNCNECQKTFTNENQWEFHLRIHFGPRPHHCELCDRRFAFHKQLIAHEMEHKKQFPYQCKFCLVSFKDQDKYNSHMLGHKLKNESKNDSIDDQEFTEEMKCKKCPRVLPDIVQLHAHAINQHGANIHCQICGFDGEDFASLAAHLKMHLNLDFECPECPKKFADNTSFNKHLANHKNDAKKMFGCDQCDKAYVDRTRLNWHKLSAHKGLRYICDYCSRTYTSLKGLKDHMQNHIKVDKMACDECGDLFILESHLKRHKQRMHADVVNIKCPICYAVYSNEFLYNRHKKGHESKAKEKPTAFVRCVECNKFFKGKKALRSHELNAHLSVGRFDCNLCDHFFRTENSLKTHIRNTHEKKEWKCLDCIIPFQTEQEYEDHMERHKSERWNKKPKKTNYHDKPITCEVCGQWTRGKYWYDIHYRKHTGERPFKCQYCSLSFVTRSNMIKHSMIHTHEPSFICTVCNRGFRTERTLRIHMYLHTGKRPLECSICGKGFATAYNQKICLIRHQQKGETMENFPEEERELIKKKEADRLKLSQIKNALVAKVGSGEKTDFIKVKKMKTIEEESSNAVASIQLSTQEYVDEYDHHYEEYILEENVEQEGEIVQEELEPGQIIYKISEFDRPQVQVAQPKKDLYLNEFLKNLEHNKTEPTDDQIILYEEEDDIVEEDNASFSDDLIEYDAGEPEPDEEIFEVVDVKPSQAIREHDEFLKAYLEKMDSLPPPKKSAPKLQIIHQKPKKYTKVEILNDEPFESKFDPDAEVETEEVIFEDENVEGYVEYSEDSHSVVDQELEAAVETIDGSTKPTKLTARQSYSRDHHVFPILPAIPHGSSEAHLKYGSNRQGASTRLISLQHNRCQYCKMKYNNKEELDEHVVIEHVPERPFVCIVCDYRFKQKCKLDRHARMHTKEKAAKCEICSREFTRMESLTAHMKLHTNEKGHSCQVCNKKFNDATSCTSHTFLCLKREKQIAESGAQIIEFQSLEVIINCMNDTDLVGRYKLDNCEIVDGINKCKFCDKTFKRIESLTEHLKVHKIQTLLEKFQCKYCSHTFISNGQYQLHVAAHERGVSVKGPPGSAHEKEVCSICAKLVKRREMNGHIKRQHPRKLYRCPECKKCHAEYSKLRKHVLAVHGDRDIKCPYCPKTFATVESMKIHQAYHENPLIPCPHCGLEFQESGLKRHIKRHELERPECCSYCPETFVNKSALRVHLMLLHKNMLNMLETVN